ncbi:YaeQ family protein [Sandaracinus amylolyticus]|uniref:YaeQ protein n=1 Tax=Sandaracinus amylolyticus TaxID=927083 RepID=A0A0F6W9G0_9BACT|nr:YaeQ family protein [Sandaracinus amylolyticus]AKF10786.1 Hypothetical protein DB32_007935 [Sandaracinus amylolyticus]
MTLTATMRRFEIELADSDRGVYETLDLRVAQHPSETDRYLVARVIARCLEHDEGVDFTRGLAESDEPALWQRDLRGDLRAWIEVGSPSADRLHKASKTGARVVVYAWKNVPQLAREIAERGVHRADELALVALDGAYLDAIATTLDRVNRWSLSVSGGALYLTIGGKLLEGGVERVSIA